MFGLSNKGKPEAVSMKSAATLMPEAWRAEVEDHVLDLRWSPDGTMLAALPSLGSIVIYQHDGGVLARLPAHAGGNGAIAWHPKKPLLATYGHDSTVRFHATPFRDAPTEFVLEKGWADRIAWNQDGTLLAATVGKKLFILNADSGAVLQTMPDHKSTICDIAWNPCMKNQITSVCDGGARMWRVGEAKPFAHFDWGGASLIVTWSPDGRWVVTGDQTPSVHLYDVKRRHPLHIQGYETKMKTMAWQSDSAWLATGGGKSITVWPCTGKKGPEGSKPIQLFGHLGDAVCMDFAPKQPLLVSGGRDGLLLLWMPHRADSPALISQRNNEITAVRWGPDNAAFAFGTETGEVFLLKVSLR